MTQQSLLIAPGSAASSVRLELGSQGWKKTPKPVPSTGPDPRRMPPAVATSETAHKQRRLKSPSGAAAEDERANNPRSLPDRIPPGTAPSIVREGQARCRWPIRRRYPIGLEVATLIGGQAGGGKKPTNGALTRRPEGPTIIGFQGLSTYLRQSGWGYRATDQEIWRPGIPDPNDHSKTLESI